MLELRNVSKRFTQAVKSQLFGLKATDMATIAASVIVISAVVLLSAYVPARRATRIDTRIPDACQASSSSNPVEALRYQ